MKKEKLTPDDELRIENEVNALNLEIKYGGSPIHISDDAPPEVIKMFLENVDKFEENYADGKLVSVYEFVGKPDYLLTEQVEDFPKEIEKLLKLLEENHVMITQPEKMKPSSFYKFLINELFEHQITDYSAEGMIHYLSYSDFHQDGPEFIEMRVEQFLLRLLTLQHDFEYEWLSEECRSNVTTVPRSVILEKIHQFRDSHQEIIPVAFEKTDFISDKGFMYMSFMIAWEGTLKGASEKERHEGMGISQLVLNEERQWELQGVEMPGFKF